MRRLSGIAALALLAAAGGPIGGASAAEKFVIGVSNTHIGNSWREEFVCSIKAEALASGLVSKVLLADREAGPSEQIADLRSLISAGVNAIIINPSDEKALNGVIRRPPRKESSSSRRINRSPLRKRTSLPATRRPTPRSERNGCSTN